MRQRCSYNTNAHGGKLVFFFSSLVQNSRPRLFIACSWLARDLCVTRARLDESRVFFVPGFELQWLYECTFLLTRVEVDFGRLPEAITQCRFKTLIIAIGRRCFCLFTHFIHHPKPWCLFIVYTKCYHIQKHFCRILFIHQFSNHLLNLTVERFCLQN